MTTQLRENLGDFSSIVCLKAMIVGMEEALGDKATAIALTSAGRARGRRLVEDLNLVGTTSSLDEIAAQMAKALGEEGTRLLILDKIEQNGEELRAYVRETVCSAGEVQGSERKCTFTLGAVWGALEKVTGKRLQGKHVESVLRGGTHDVFSFLPL